MQMKKLILLTVVAALPLGLMAQDDDMYFVPTKENIAKEAKTYGMPKDVYYSGSQRNVDEYNRRAWSSVAPIDSVGNDIIDFSAVRGVYPDSAYSEVTENDYQYTKRMSRFEGYSPSEVYWEGYRDGRWMSPWYYSSYYPWYDSYWYWNDPWYYSGYYGWYSPWYYGGYYRPWHYYGGWYGPRYHYGGGVHYRPSGSGRFHVSRPASSGSRSYSHSSGRFNNSSRYSNGSFGNGSYMSRGSSSSGGTRSSGGSFSSGGGGTRSSGGGGSFGGGGGGRSGGGSTFSRGR